MTRSRSSRSSDAASTASIARLRHDRGAVGVEHHDVAGGDPLPADRDRLVERARRVLRGAADADPARPDRQPELGEILDVAHRAVDEQRRDALLERLRGEQVADERDRERVGHREHEHVAGPRVGDRGVHHQVVALPAQHGPGRAGGARAGDDPLQVEVDEPLAARGLVDGRGAEPRELGDDAHSSATTWGSTRWNASA